MPSNLFRFSVTASKVAGTRLVIEAVTGVQILVTASKVVGTGFVIEAVTGEPANRPSYSPFTLLRILVALSRGLPGGWLGVGWGLRGGFEGPGPPNPQATPSKGSSNALDRWEGWGSDADWKWDPRGSCRGPFGCQRGEGGSAIKDDGNTMPGRTDWRVMTGGEKCDENG